MTILKNKQEVWRMAQQGMDSVMKRILVSILLLLLVASCTGGAEQATASVNPTEGVTPSIETQNTATDEALPAQTATPAPPESKDLLPTQNTATEQVIDKKTFFDMLSNNGGCSLPCVLGVTPGIVYAKERESNWIETAEFEGDEVVSFKTEILDNFVIFASRVYGSESVSVISLSYEIQEVGDDFRINNLRLSTFQHYTTEENFGQAMYGTNEYSRLMEGYSSNTILKQYGKPTQIVIRIEHYESFHIQQPAFDIIYLGYYYGHHQFYVTYELIVDDTTKDFDICPSNGFVSLWAWPVQEEGGDSFFTNSYIDTSLDLASYQEINSFDGVTTEKFYEVMSGEDVEACFTMQGIK